MGLFATARSSKFVRRIAVLATGTIFAQVLLVLASPILTRLYTPNDFGMFAVFTSLVGSISVSITGKYETAMLLPKAKSVASHLFGVSIWFAFAGTLVAYLIILLSRGVILDWLKAPELAGWIFVVPLVALMTGLFDLGGYLANRNMQYNLMARAKMLQAIVIVCVSIGLGAAQAGFIGMLFGYAIGIGVATFYMFRRNSTAFLGDVFARIKRKVIIARRFSDYPIYFGSTALLGSITQGLPIFFFAHYYSADIVGHFALVIRVIFAPLSFISMSVFQVNLKTVIDMINDDGSPTRHVNALGRMLFLIATAPAIVLIVWGPQIFRFVFGEGWEEAGEYAQILAFSLPIRFASSTLSSTLAATRNNQYNALWKVVSFLVTLLVLISAVTLDSFKEALIALVTVEIFLYALYYYLIYRSTKKLDKFSR